MSALLTLLSAGLVVGALFASLCGLVWLCIRLSKPVALWLVEDRAPTYEWAAPGLVIVHDSDPTYRGVA